MLKVKMVLEYDGSVFKGFAVQKGRVNTVSNKIYLALELLNIKSKFNASGRTDRGVHALNQVIDLVLPEYWSDIKKLQSSLNKILLPHIYIKRILVVDDLFHARFSAKKRVYRYIVSTDSYSVFKSRYLTYHNRDLDEKNIKSAIRVFKGRHNFEYFKKSGSDTTNYIRTIYKCRFYKYKDLYIFMFVADGYLRSQIRIMVSFLLKISDGVLSIDNLIEQLNSKKVYSRDLASPDGLYLSRVHYL
jgi:tRNA pseudouridine38-40 synthase